MSNLIKNKLNSLLANWPSLAVFACAWLYDQGYSYELINKYRKNHWLQAVGRGAVARVGDKIDWAGGLYAIQNQLKLPIHVGGKSALLVKGYGHFIPQGQNWPLILVADANTILPAWFKTYDWGVKLEYVTLSLFENASHLAMSELDQGAFAIKVAAPERAIMEMLSLVPQEEFFEEAKLLMDGLTTLRPKIVQELLERCLSLKVKRLFLFLAEECNHAWMKKLNLSKIKLGKGKRVIEKGGAFNPKYLITVPRGIIRSEPEDTV